MNIFAVDPDTIICAQALDDVRLRKMCLETAQLLSTALRLRPDLHHRPSASARHLLYKVTHPGNDVSLWVRENVQNFAWTHSLLVELILEYQYRFAKAHGSSCIIQLLGVPRITHDPTSFCNRARRKDMNLDFTMLPVHDAYRVYLNTRWGHEQPTWTNRGAPAWRIEHAHA